MGVRISDHLKQEVEKDIKRRGIKNMTAYVEMALIHELNGKTDKGLLYELEDIQKIIQSKIEKISDSEDTIIQEKQVNDYVLEVQKLQEKRGYVTNAVIKRNASLSGVTYDEFLKLLNKSNIDVIITK